MTQEELAEVLSLSPQAISRWKNDAAMPNISLLPVLANLFSVTTDHLLGADIDQKERRIQEVVRSAMAKGKEGHHQDAAEIVRKGLSEYPGSHSCRITFPCRSCISWRSSRTLSALQPPKRVPCSSPAWEEHAATR